MRHRWRAALSLGLLGVLVVSLGGTAVAQDGVEDNELDRFMEQVLARRDENRIARGQYVFDEVERFTVTGYDGEVYNAYTREYIWYRRDGVFVRSPVRIDGIAPSETEWRRYEADWLEAEGERTRNARDPSEDQCVPSDDTRERPTGGGGTGEHDGPSDLAGAADLRPRFLSESYWLDFEFEPGNYYFAGREQLVVRHVIIFGHGHGLQRAIIDESQHRTPERLIMAQH